MNRTGAHDSGRVWQAGTPISAGCQVEEYCYCYTPSGVLEEIHKGQKDCAGIFTFEATRAG